jgi:hypothetical protein
MRGCMIVVAFPGLLITPFVQCFNEARTLAKKQKIAGEARAMVEADQNRQDEERRKKSEELRRQGMRRP